MEFADRLYGVTMQESGVTKLVQRNLVNKLKMQSKVQTWYLLLWLGGGTGNFAAPVVAKIARRNH